MKRAELHKSPACLSCQQIVLFLWKPTRIVSYVKRFKDEHDHEHSDSVFLTFALDLAVSHEPPCTQHVDSADILFSVPVFL